jgi:transposase
MKRSISVEGQQRRKFWENHLRSWQVSGLSQTGYCREHGLSNKSFVYWKKRLVPARVALSLVEVPRVQPPSVLSACAPLRLMLGNRYGIEIERGFDEQTLERLLRVLEKR